MSGEPKLERRDERQRFSNPCQRTYKQRLMIRAIRGGTGRQVVHQEPIEKHTRMYVRGGSVPRSIWPRELGQTDKDRHRGRALEVVGVGEFYERR